VAAGAAEAAGEAVACGAGGLGLAGGACSWANKVALQSSADQRTRASFIFSTFLNRVSPQGTPNGWVLYSKVYDLMRS